MVGSFVGTEIANQFFGGFESASESDRIKDSLVHSEVGEPHVLDEDDDDLSLGDTEPD